MAYLTTKPRDSRYDFKNDVQLLLSMIDDLSEVMRFNLHCTNRTSWRGVGSVGRG